MSRHGVSAAERRRIAEDLARLASAGEREAVRISRELYERIRHLPPDEALRVLREAMPAAADAVASAVGARFTQAAASGAARAAAGIGLGGGWKGAADALAARWRTQGGIRLSAAIHGRNAELLRGVETAIRSSIAHGRGALDLAQRLRDEVGSAPVAQLTRRLDELQARARATVAASGSPRALSLRTATGRSMASLDSYAARLRRTEFGMGAATEHALDRIASAVKAGNTASVDEALKWWTYDKQAYHQRVVARTEIARGFTEGFKENADVPWVVGFQWNVESFADRERDICDVFGNQNLYGLGAGIYPFDKVPELPAHPNCNCYLTEYMDDSVDEEDTRPPAPPQRAGATAKWLKSQPAAVQREILGASGYEAFRRSAGREVPGWLRV